MDRRLPPLGGRRIASSFCRAVRRSRSRLRVRDGPVLRQNSVRREVVDLPALIRRRSWFDDHPPAPAASPPALSLRRPPPARPRKPRLAPVSSPSTSERCPGRSYARLIGFSRWRWLG